MLSPSFKLLLPVYILSLFSSLILFSISTQLFLQQLIWIFLGTVIIAIFWKFDLRGIIHNRETIFIFYIFSVFLVAVPFLFPPNRGIHAWIPVGPFFIQPVEILKITLILIYAYFFARHHVSIARLKTIAIPFFLFVIPSLIILRQPDLGSVLVLFGMWVSFIILSGLRFRHLVFGLVFLAFMSVFLWGALD